MNSSYRSNIASRFGLTLRTFYFCRCFILPFLYDSLVRTINDYITSTEIHSVILLVINK